MNTRARRGEVWCTTDDDLSWLIVSCDKWNAMPNRDWVLGIRVVPGQTNPAGYTVVTRVAGVEYSLLVDLIQPLPRDLLSGPEWVAGASTIAEVDDLLRQIVGPRKRRLSTMWPPRFPRSGQYRYYDLDLDGMGPKPFIVVSNDAFADDVEHKWAVMIRKGSNSWPPGPFEVKIGGTGTGDNVGKAFCWDIRTINASEMIDRKHNPSVAGPVQAQIQREVRLVLGL